MGCDLRACGARASRAGLCRWLDCQRSKANWFAGLAKAQDARALGFFERVGLDGRFTGSGRAGGFWRRAVGAAAAGKPAIEASDIYLVEAGLFFASVAVNRYSPIVGSLCDRYFPESIVTVALHEVLYKYGITVRTLRVPTRLHFCDDVVAEFQNTDRVLAVFVCFIKEILPFNATIVGGLRSTTPQSTAPDDVHGSRPLHTHARPHAHSHTLSRYA